MFAVGRFLRPVQFLGQVRHRGTVLSPKGVRQSACPNPSSSSNGTITNGTGGRYGVHNWSAKHQRTTLRRSVTRTAAGKSIGERFFMEPLHPTASPFCAAAPWGDRPMPFGWTQQTLIEGILLRGARARRVGHLSGALCTSGHVAELQRGTVGNLILLHFTSRLLQTTRVFCKHACTVHTLYW